MQCNKKVATRGCTNANATTQMQLDKMQKQQNNNRHQYTTRHNTRQWVTMLDTHKKTQHDAKGHIAHNNAALNDKMTKPMMMKWLMMKWLGWNDLTAPMQQNAKKMQHNAKNPTKHKKLMQQKSKCNTKTDAT